MRKLLLASVLIVLGNDSIVQISLAVVVSCVALLLHVDYKPFEDRLDQVISLTSTGAHPQITFLLSLTFFFFFFWTPSSCKEWP